jgi:pimeloyl-ACP methyl ester carboxylesterase
MDYALDTQVGDIEAFVNYLGKEKLILVGMSMGGINSIRYASLHSSRLLGLVIVDVGPDLHVEGAEKITKFTREESELDSVEEFVERAMAFNPRRNPALLKRSLMHNLRQTPEGRWTWKYDKRHRAKWDLQKLKEQHAKLWDDVPNIKCPTLVARGDHSDVFLDEDAEKIVGVLPDARWVRIANAGHTIQGDNPRDLVAEMRGFFEERGI